MDYLVKSLGEIFAGGPAFNSKGVTLTVRCGTATKLASHPIADPGAAFSNRGSTDKMSLVHHIGRDVD